MASHKKHKKKGDCRSCSCAVIRVSASRFEKYGPCSDPRDCGDESGELIIGLLGEAGHRAIYRSVGESPEEIAREVAVMLGDADAVILAGGTGLTGGDVTVEAVAPMLEKTIPGFGELFRVRSYREIGTPAILTRTLAGVIGGRVVFCIPGSPDAARVALGEIIIPELGHIISHARSP
jgi:molybdopterin adenylyltransferase